MLLLLATFTLSAAQPARAAVHPLVVRTPDASWAADAQVEFLSVAARQPLALVSTFAVEDMLDTQPSRTCFWRDTCLVELARTTQAELALLATINATPAELEVTVRVVAPDGRLLREVSRLAHPKKRGTPTGPALRALFEALFDELDVATIDLTPPQEVPPPEVIQPTPPADALARTAPPPSSNAARVAAITGLGLTALSLGAAGGVALSTIEDARQLAALKQGDSIPQTELARAQSLATRETAATALLITAGALAVTSGVLLLFSFDAPRVAVAPVGGGAVLVLGGRWP